MRRKTVKRIERTMFDGFQKLVLPFLFSKFFLGKYYFLRTRTNKIDTKQRIFKLNKFQFS